jgi:L-seryl-tRNA(Ser) seleniumtransferase
VDLSKLPKVDRVLEAAELSELRASLGRKALVVLAREALSFARARARAGGPVASLADVVAEVQRAGARRLEQGLEPVINATGVILHTNLGRAPLPAASIAHIASTAGRYSTLELDAELGTRTRRGVHVERQLAELVGAEDVLLVNNNAAAVLLTLSGLAARREVIVSRGELVEIGGGFRIPEVLARSGASLVEVGTTNRTRVEDYARAVRDQSACLLRVHPSNFKITGFTERPSLGELVELARRVGLPLVKDLGGGLVTELPTSVAPNEQVREPSVQACLRAGVDLVCFSLDKLFGGPQGGVVAGKAGLVRRLRDDPLSRALRVDKLALAALEPILDAYRRGAWGEIPTQALLRAPVEELRERVLGWQRALGEHVSRTEIVESAAAIGGGTLAEAPVASVALRVACPNPERLAQRLRRSRPPVLGRVLEGAVLLDARSVFANEDAALVTALARALEEDAPRLERAADPW